MKFLVLGVCYSSFPNLIVTLMDLLRSVCSRVTRYFQSNARITITSTYTLDASPSYHPMYGTGESVSISLSIFTQTPCNGNTRWKWTHLAEAVSLWFLHFLICRNELLWHKHFPSLHMRVAGTRKLSCCSWHSMQSHKMTKHKIHVDEFAGKLCVATNHQVLLVDSVATRRPGKFVCAYSSSSPFGFFVFVFHLHFTGMNTTLQRPTTYHNVFASLRISLRHRVHSETERAQAFSAEMCFFLQKSGPYSIRHTLWRYARVPVCTISIRMCRNIFKSTSFSEVSVSLVLALLQMCTSSQWRSAERIENLSQWNWTETYIKNVICVLCIGIPFNWRKRK